MPGGFVCSGSMKAEADAVKAKAPPSPAAGERAS